MMYHGHKAKIINYKPTTAVVDLNEGLFMSSVRNEQF